MEPDFNRDRKYKHFIERLRKLFSKLGTPQKAEEKLQKIKEEESQIRPRTFTFVLDLKLLEIIHYKDPYNVLGFSNNLSLKEFIYSIHPSYFDIYAAFALASYQVAFNHKDQLEALSQRLNIEIPIWFKSDDKYMWLQQSGSPVQFDENNLMTAHINFYTKLSEFNSINPRKPMVVFKDPNDDSELNQNLYDEAKKNFIDFLTTEIITYHSGKHKDSQQKIKKLIFAYWKLYTDNYGSSEYKKPTAKDILRILPDDFTSEGSVDRYNSYVKKLVEQFFYGPIFDDSFEQAHEFGKFLFLLFGPYDEQIDN